MAQFVSKLQHKNYEKGEFSDEQTRTLDETISLIKNFPWDEERPLTDIQLTGPSVTIENENGEYLKVGLYFYKHFSLYLLDEGNHVYEYHVPDIDFACHFVADYFDNNLSLKNFKKHLFNIKTREHFATNTFEYRVSGWRVIGISSILILLDLMLLIIFVLALRHPLKPVSLYFLLPTPILSGVLIFIYYRFLKSKKMFLKISKGNDLFEFGYDTENIRTYTKKDINEILVYGSNRTSRQFRIALIPILSIQVFVIKFSNGDQIKFSNMLISSISFYKKFNFELIKRLNESILGEL